MILASLVEKGLGSSRSGTRGKTLEILAEIVAAALASKAPIAVITGGEPAMYDLNPLCKELKAQGIKVHIETSGAYPLRGDLDWITVSPKKFKPALEATLAQAHELKVVVYHPSDVSWAEEHAQHISPIYTFLVDIVK
jgi:organic radical activating enzyme